MRLRTYAAVVACMALMTAALAGPAGATPLASGGVIDAQGQGLSLANGGVGLEDLGAGVKNLTVTIGGPVQQAILYWAGRELEGCPEGSCFDPPNAAPFRDQEMIFAGIPITGTIVGREDDVHTSVGYKADVTSIVGAAGTGPQSFTIQDGATSNNFDNLMGAGLLVLYTNPGDPQSYRVLVFEGVDFAYFREDFSPFPANRVTDPVNFNYVAASDARTAQLTVFSGDAEPTRPDTITVSDNPSLTNQLDGSDGVEWDTDEFAINIPSGTSTTTVQLHSAPQPNPDSLVWVLSALRLPLPAPPHVPGDEGCTPGYWKNHTGSWAGTGYSPGQTTGSVFTVPAQFSPSTSLINALNGGGGSGTTGAASTLMRAAVAALLNAAHPDVDYASSTSQVISDVNAALASNDRDTMLALAVQLDTDNNGGCPIN